MKSENLDPVTKRLMAQMANPLLTQSHNARRDDVLMASHGDWVALITYRECMMEPGVYYWYYDSAHQNQVKVWLRDKRYGSIDHGKEASVVQAAWKAAYLTIQFARGSYVGHNHAPSFTREDEDAAPAARVAAGEQLDIFGNSTLATLAKGRA